MKFEIGSDKQANGDDGGKKECSASWGKMAVGGNASSDLPAPERCWDWSKDLVRRVSTQAEVSQPEHAKQRAARSRCLRRDRESECGCNQILLKMGS